MIGLLPPNHHFFFIRWARLAGAIVCVAALAGAPNRAMAQQTLTADSGFVRQVMAECPTDLRWLNQIGGWQVQWATQLENQPIDTAVRRDAALALWRTVPDALAEATAALREGLREGRAVPGLVVRRVLDRIEGLLDAPPSELPLASPAQRSNDDEFSDQWDELVRTSLRPAITAFRDFIEREYLPKARDELGLSALPGGVECYADAVEAWASLRMPAEEIEAHGRKHLALLEEELVRLAAPRYGSTARQILDLLCTGNFEEAFDSPDDVIAHAKAAIKRARLAMPEWFATTGDMDVIIVPIPQNLEASFPAGLYSVTK